MFLATLVFQGRVRWGYLAWCHTYRTAAASASASASSIWLGRAGLRHLCRLVVYAPASSPTPKPTPPSAIPSPHPLPSRSVDGFERVRQIAYRRNSSLLSMLDEADRRTACTVCKSSVVIGVALLPCMPLVTFALSLSHHRGPSLFEVLGEAKPASNART